MAMNDEKRLFSGWRATSDLGPNAPPDSLTLLGSFTTITEFWRFFNNLGREHPLDMLPNYINFRMCRGGTIPSKAAVIDRQYASGSFDIQLSNKGTPMHEKFIKLCLLACCELLGTEVNAVVLSADQHVSVWMESEENGQRFTDKLCKYFTNEELLNATYYSHGQNLPSARKPNGNQNKPVTIYNFRDAFAIQQNKGSKVMPTDLHSVQWNVIAKEATQWMVQLQNAGGAPPGLKKPNRLKLKPSKTQQELEEKNKMRPLAVPRKGNKDQMLAKQIQRIMTNIRNLYDNYYQVTFTQDLELKLRNILNEEKCPLSMTGYDREDGSGSDSEDINYDNSLGFAILKCRLLNCQHVIRLSCAKQVVSNTFRTFHDSEFTKIAYKSLKPLSVASNPNNISPRRRFKMELNFFHLLSDACADSIYVPEQVQSVVDSNNLSEYILLYYDHNLSPYKNKTSYHYVSNNQAQTHLRFVRGRVIANLQDLNSKTKYQMNFTYDLSKHQSTGLLKQNETNGGVLLEHIEPNTNSSYKFYLQKEPIATNLQTKNVYYQYKLVAIQFDFVVKQSTPTLSPTFGVVNNETNTQQTPQSNPQQTVVVPVPGQAQIVTLSPVATQPQTHPNISPMNIANMNASMNMASASGPPPVLQHPQHAPQILPTTLSPHLHSQNPVITVTTPTAIPVQAYATNYIVNSPQIQSRQTANPTHQYSSNINVASLTAPNNMPQSSGVPIFPMSPGGTIGLSAAANHQNSQMLQTANVYAQGPPPNSSPMLNTNTANIQSILSQTQNQMGMHQPVSSSVTNMGGMGGMAGMTGMHSTPTMHPYSPMDPNVGSTRMTYGNALNNSNAQSMISQLGLSNPVSPGLSNMQNMSNMQQMPHMSHQMQMPNMSAPMSGMGNTMQNMPNMSAPMSGMQASHLGYGMSHTSPGLYPQSNAYPPPMSPATQSINSSLGALDSQGLGQFHLMSNSGIGSNQNMYGGFQNLNNINRQSNMINNINGLMGMSQSQNMSINNQMNQMNQMRNNQNKTVTVVHKQQDRYGNNQSQNMGGYDNQMRNQRNNNRNQGRGYAPINRNKGKQQRGYGNQSQNQNQNQNRQSYQRNKQQQNNKRLHDARMKQNFTSRGHYQMPPQSRKMGRNYGQSDQNQNNYSNSGQNNSGGGGNGGQGQGQRGGNSAFGFPANANPIPQGQLNNQNSNVGNDKGGNENEGNDGDGKELSLQDMLSPQSDGATPTAQTTTPGGTALAGVMSPKTPTMIDHVVDRVYFIAKTQSGSRFVQEKLSDKQYFGLFFKELKCHVAELMVDNFGHYAIEALFSHCDDHQRLQLVANLSNHMPQVACHKQGSFSIQAMMDTLSTAEQIKYLVDALNRDIKKIILNHSGHYVILRFLQRYDYPYSKFIHKALMQHTLDLATDHYGLRVMKASVDAGPIQEMSAVFASIVKHANTLVENQYGNYIIQHLLDLGPKEVTDTIKEKMHGKFVRYSKQKFSSNVVEKCLRHSTNELKQNIHTKDWATIIVRELLTKAGDLISDKYGNYCLQTALQAATDHPCLLQEFEKSTKPHLDTLRENVKAKWCKLLEAAIEKRKKRNQMPQNMPPMNNNPSSNHNPNPSQNQNERYSQNNNGNMQQNNPNNNNGNQQNPMQPNQAQMQQSQMQMQQANMQNQMQNMQVQQQQMQ